jgi:hypothetical protein
MSTRLGIALFSGVVASTLVVSGYQAWQRRPSFLHEHEWGVRGDGVANAVQRVDEFEDERGRFSYYTGGRSGDVGSLVAAPTRVVAAVTYGSVSVRLLAFPTYEHPRAEQDALELARIVSRATTDVFPAEAIPVEIDLHFMPEGARFSLARRIDWREGRSYALALFAREQKLVYTTPAHELYHVLHTRWPLQATPEATRRHGAASSYEEAAAELYAACGELLANSVWPRPAPSQARVTIVDPALGDRVFEVSLDEDERRAVLEMMRTGANGAGFVGFGPLLAATVFEHIFSGATRITVDSSQGTRVLVLCKEAAFNPFVIETWLAAVDDDRRAASSQGSAE